MDNKLFIAVLLFALGNTAFAAREDQYLFSNFLAGSTDSMSPSATKNIDSASSYGIYAGYQFNKFFALEGGYSWLLTNSNATTPGGGVIGVNSLSGTEIAAILSFPVIDGISPFLRVGSATMSETFAASGGATTTTPLGGVTGGLGVQFNLERFALRIGYSAYNLKDPAGNNEIPRNAYGALILKY